jgi:hypothetical protein
MEETRENVITIPLMFTLSSTSPARRRTSIDARRI